MLLSLLIFSQFSTSREFFEISLKKKTRKVNPKFDESDRASPLKPQHNGHYCHPADLTSLPICR